MESTEKKTTWKCWYKNRSVASWQMHKNDTRSWIWKYGGVLNRCSRSIQSLVIRCFHDLVLYKDCSKTVQSPIFHFKKKRNLDCAVQFKRVSNALNLKENSPFVNCFNDNKRTNQRTGLCICPYAFSYCLKTNFTFHINFVFHSSFSKSSVSLHCTSLTL